MTEGLLGGFLALRTGKRIETLVPNSTFLENNVTNWTYNDRRLRHSVRVGVAYGSDTRRVVQLLEQAASSHGKVLSSPEPYVLFEDFADSALVSRSISGST